MRSVTRAPPGLGTTRPVASMCCPLQEFRSQEGGASGLLIQGQDRGGNGEGRSLGS